MKHVVLPLITFGLFAMVVADRLSHALASGHHAASIQEPGDTGSAVLGLEGSASGGAAATAHTGSSSGIASSTDRLARLAARQQLTREGGLTYLDLQVKLARDQGYVETLFGRRRYIPEIKERNFNLRAFAERTAANTPLQGSAADLIKIAMTRIHVALRAAKLEAKLLLQVHDELVLEAPDHEVDQVVRLVREHMEGAAALKVPLVVDVGVGDNWLDAKR